MTDLWPSALRLAGARRRSKGADRHEGGYVLFLTAILLIPLIGIAAIGIDFGVWYLQSSRNQAAADAAALAGAVWMPDQARAAVAIDSALTRNGLDPGVDSTIDIEYLGSNSVKVSVSTKSELAFTSMFIDEFAITRAAIGRYTPPTSLGSPTNQLGSPGLWLAISGDCSVRENGDLLAARNVAGYPGGNYPPSSCAGGNPNPEYSGEYFMAVEIKDTLGAPINVQVYDGSYSPSATSTTDLELRPPSNFETTFTLYDNNGVVFDPASATVLASRTYGTNDAGATGNWTTIGTINSPSPGIYFIRVSTNGSGGLDSFGSNGYALRAFNGGSYSSCSTLAGAADFSLQCPQVYAVEHLPLYASLSNGSEDFFLAEIPDFHAGKTLEISLFDVGEGAERIQILDPDGNPVAFTWTTDCAITSPGIPPGCSGASEAWNNPATGLVEQHTLNVAGPGNQLYTNTLSTSLWNDRTVVITIDLPNNYATAYSDRWWSVRYTFGADITDRTTWSARVVGDPVRLTG